MDSPDTAEKVIQRCDSSSSYDGGDGRRSSATSGCGSEVSDMALLEDEFRSILLSRVNSIDSDSVLSIFSSLSLSSSFDYSEDTFEPEDEPPESEELHGDLTAASQILARTGTGASRGGTSHRSTTSIREVDLIPFDAAQDLRRIAERMIASGYSRECFQAYSSVRKAAVDQSLKQLGIEKLSIGDVQRLPWESLESKIRKWIHAARKCIRVVLASERRLCDTIFAEILEPGSDGPFGETVKGAALQLFGFAEAIGIGRRSPEKLFKILDLHDALADLLPDISVVFGSSSPVPTQVEEILTRLAEAARGILSEFESAVHTELSKTPVPGGTIHPLTRYVMNYISLIAEYKQTMSQLIVSKPSVVNRQFAEVSDESQPPLPLVSLYDIENGSPLAAHLVWIIAILDSNIESKSKLYKDAALGFLFVMNNVHYIVHKVKGLQELRELIGDDYLRRLTRKFQQAATNYQRAALVKVLQYLRDEGIHVSGSSSSSALKGMLRERFKAFNTAFDEAHRTQAMWSVPDMQLREELRISVSEKLLPAYRSFLGRFKHHIESGRHPEMYIKYSVEDLETALADFFEGISPSHQGRRRIH